MLNIINKQFDEIVLDSVSQLYDGRVLFSCTVDKTKYLAVLVENGISAFEWIFAPVSPERFVKIRAGEINLHDAFKDSETGAVYMVRVKKMSDNIFDVTERACLQLSDEELPLKSAFLP